MKKLNAIIRILKSNNFILIYGIRQRVEGNRYRILTKVQRHTNLTVYEDIEAMKESFNKVKSKA